MKETSTYNGGAGSGMTLLSPSLQRGLRANNQAEAATRSTVFDFDGFTLEAVRRRHHDEDQQHHHHHHAHPSNQHTHGLASHTTTASTSGGSPPSPSPFRASSAVRYPKSMSYDRLTSMDSFETSSFRSLEDFDWNGPPPGTSRTQRYASHLSSLSYSGPSGGGGGGGGGGGSKRMSVASSSASFAQSNGQGRREKTEIVMRGWLQRRRGRMLKRWKTQFCLLKDDHKLCIYANEDIVNGKLQQRFHVLRVTYSDKNGSFQVIGIDKDETPYKEEFRALDETGWRTWFYAFREYFDEASLQRAFDRMPELSHGADTQLMDEDDHDFAHEVEEMIMRPYAHGGDTMSSSTPSHHGRDSIASSRDGGASGQGVRRKTVVIDMEKGSVAPTSSYSNQFNLDDLSDDLPEYLSWNRGPSATTVPRNHRIGSMHAVKPLASTVVDDVREETSSAEVVLDCPMIERDSQTPMPILEGRASESVVSTSGVELTETGFSWNRP